MAFDWYLKSAEAGSTTGMSYLANAYLKGIGVAIDKSTAILWYKKAADKGDEKSKQKLKELGIN
jgi:TPR repeat protein